MLAANPYLNEGRQLYQSMQYEQAAEKLRLAVQVPTSTADELRTSSDLLARALSALGRAADAEAAYAALLARDPEAPAPDDASPKIRALFRGAKARLYPPGFVWLTPMPAPMGRIEVQLVDPWGAVASVELAEAGRAPRLLARSGGTASGDLAPGRFEVVARNDAGQALAAISGGIEVTAPPAARLLVPSESSPPTPALSVVAAPQARAVGWPVWTLAAASLAAAGGGAALAVSSSADSRAAGTAGWASETRSLDDSARDKALAANLLVGAAVTAAAGALVVWLREQRGDGMNLRAVRPSSR